MASATMLCERCETEFDQAEEIDGLCNDCFEEPLRRDRLRVWHQRMLRILGEKHPLTMLARVAIDSGDRTVIKDAAEALASDKSLWADVCGPPKEALLEQCDSCDLNPFQQFDGYLQGPDSQAYCSVSPYTSWHPTDYTAIRVLVSTDAPREKVIPLMQKLAERITNEYSQPPREISDEDAIPF